MINLTALRILHKNARVLHVDAEIPGDIRGVRKIRVFGIGSKIGGTCMATGDLIEDVRPEWVTGVYATD